MYNQLSQVGLKCRLQSAQKARLHIVRPKCTNEAGGVPSTQSGAVNASRPCAWRDICPPRLILDESVLYRLGMFSDYFVLGSMNFTAFLQCICMFCHEMARHKTITRSWEERGVLSLRFHERKYRVTYEDDSPERAEAVAFFGEALIPAMNLPHALDQMSERTAQAYLDAHPTQEQWSMLLLDRRVTFGDDDLSRLEHLPELKRIHSHADHLTDRGVSFIASIAGLQHLLIYSPLVTDRCLEDIARLRQLQTIDLQASHLISRKAFDALVSDLPDLVSIYPPR